MLKEEILGRFIDLIPPGINRVILFGSYAYGFPHNESDVDLYVDLYVVTADDFIPRDFNENSRIFLKVSKKIRDIKERVPMDLIVHTQPMHAKFRNLNCSFSKQILNQGEVLYESGNGAGMD